MQAPQSGNKFIVGWLTLREGAQTAFDALTGPYVAACRAEPGCRFFEMIRKREEPLTVLVCECFLTEEAHALHCRQPYFTAFWEALHTIALVARFENVIAGAINPDAYDFSTGKPI
jgi:quinol monooxygenase YgiN